MFQRRPSEREATFLNPLSFYGLADIMKGLSPQSLEASSEALGSACREIEESVRELGQAQDAVTLEAHRATIRRNPFDRTQDDEKDPLAGLRHSLSNSNFLSVIYGIASHLLDGLQQLRDISRELVPQPLLLGNRVEGLPETNEDFQRFALQVQMNLVPMQSFIEGVLAAEAAPNLAVDISRKVVGFLDSYYGALLKRHTTGGVLIHRDPITTDLALSIYENIDANGEIQEGTNPDEVSAYSIHKANLLIHTVQTGLIRSFTEDPETLIKFIQDILLSIHLQAMALRKIAQPLAKEVRKVLKRTWDTPYVMSETDFRRAVEAIPGLNPRNIVYKEKTGLLTAEERKEIEFRNTTIEQVVALLIAGKSERIVPYVLSRKKSLRDWHMEENSFFVCKIGQGNQFTGEAPGMLSVVPGSKPTVNLDEVVGSGFSEVRTFIENVTIGAKWHDLFIATSPSKRADKSNVLLVGPQGCGKTEVLRAVASDRQSIGIFAQASDFLTCWKGEAEKNPKRLFESGIRIQRDSGKQVFFLIDEIDTILNDDRGQSAFGGTNLATEFQVLMDGITTYPHLALWGATNHPERIPMPLVRRFARVVVVGELEQADRVKLLKQFVGFLPVSPAFQDQAWEDSALLLDGAVGDIIRKVADQVWREKMSGFVTDNPDEAERLIKHLNRDGKFQVAHFNERERHQFQQELRPYVEVNPGDVNRAIESHLSNIAIQQEIETCKQTYAMARRFVEGANAR